ncbi:MAG TPA: hypothetical protein VHG08_16660 [Longimicrobium sp.]|nr:hypothetical protein [Longimicrobium sp.]
MTAYDESVFINCPFDEPYAPIFHAIVFAVHDSGFFARCALEADNGGEVRIQKIARIIRDCRHGIHDLSRTDIDAQIGLPRFNMPLELGMFLGAQMLGPARQQAKNCLVLDVERYRYCNFCSDISGQDIKAHGGDPERALEAVRNWLGTFSLAYGMGTIPGPKKMKERYALFVSQLPLQCAGVHLEPHALGFLELRTMVQEWLNQNPV